MNIIIAAMAFVAIFAAGDASAFSGKTSTDRPYYVYPSVTWEQRAGLLFASATARRFRTDCPMQAEFTHDNFQQSLERVAKFIDELGADAVAIAQINEAIEGYIGVLVKTPKPGSTGKEEYCDKAPS